MHTSAHCDSNAHNYVPLATPLCPLVTGETSPAVVSLSDHFRFVWRSFRGRHVVSVCRLLNSSVSYSTVHRLQLHSAQYTLCSCAVHRDPR